MKTTNDPGKDDFIDILHEQEFINPVCPLSMAQDGSNESAWCLYTPRFVCVRENNLISVCRVCSGLKRVLRQERRRMMENGNGDNATLGL